MKKALIKDSFKEIKKTYKRFLSILVMALLGVGFFAGLRATPSDMALTLDNYADDTNLFDIEIISTLGLTDDDAEEIKKIEGIENVYPSYEEDVYMKIEDNESVIKVIEYNEEYNRITLLEGNFPKKIDECVIDSYMQRESGIQIGDYIEIREDLEIDEDDEENSEEPTFTKTKLKVTGIVTSPLYMSAERDISTLGNGKVDYFIYVPKSNITSDVYTSIYVSVVNTKEEHALSLEYKEKVNKVINSLEEIKEERQDIRYQSLIDEANEKLDDAEKELEEEKTKAEKEIKDAEKDLADGKKEIEDAKKKITDGEKELQDARNTLNTEMANAEKVINENYDKLTQGEIELNENEEIAEKGFEEALKQEEELKINLDQIVQGLETIDFNIKGLEYKIATSENDIEKQALIKNLETLKVQKTELEKNQQQIMLGIETIESEIERGRQEITSARENIIKGYNEFDAARVRLSEERAKAESELAKAESDIQKAKNELADGEKELADGEKELNDAKEEFEEEIEKAENKLIDARTKVNDIKKAKWYIYDREDLSGYNEYDNNVDNIDQIAKAFPIVFFVIAVLISLTSMTRMVEEQRVQIGTLKALGYTNIQIAFKYLLYATTATVVGGAIGIAFGMQFFPRVIIYLYEMMYIHMEPIIVFNIKYSVIGLGVMLLCMNGASLYAAYKELNSVPSELMRPKAPKIGKRVFLENIPFIWKHFSFTQKVTLRNMFRYKKRFLMTIIGIAGCTALILAGFGLQDSILHVIPNQYDNIFKYDMMVYLNDDLTNEEVISFKEKIEEKEEISGVKEIYQESASLENVDLSEDIQMIVVKDINDLNEYISFYDMDNEKEEVFLDDNTIIITDKLSEIIDVNVGDEILLVDSDKESHKIKVGKIAEHYLSHYIYMTENTYKEIFGKVKETNILYVNYAQELEKVEEEKISEELLKSSKTLSVILVSNLRTSMDDVFESMNIVVYVLIVSAGLLAFVVLYNLTNVNISERIRELATIKVLGFYDKEVFDYVSREMVLLTIIGMIIGLLFGHVLSNFILTTCEVNMTRFPRYISMQSQIISLAITGIFATIVNFMTYFSLKKIDMIESLKSIE